MLPTALEQLLSRGVLAHATLLIGGDPATHSAIAHGIQAKLAVAPADAFHVEERPAVDELRRLLARIHLKPNQSRYTGVFLHRIELWSVEAANTLLKTIEEPPPYARLVLFAGDDTGILPTIRSRCARYRLAGSPSASAMVPTLAAMADMPLHIAFAKLQQLSDDVPIQEIVQAWVSSTPGAFRARLLARAATFGGHPVNRRLALESLLVEYRVQAGERTT